MFFSSQMGKQQQLPNDNILIAESDAGRVIEINLDGEIVWQYTNRWSESQVATIMEGVRFPLGYFNLSDEECSRE
jgi:hypothetical protein